jgi:protein-disulfide isomerase
MSLSTKQLAVPIRPRDHTLGPKSAPITLVEYGDFECPSCGSAYPVLQDLLRKFEGKLLFVYRHFPLTEAHEHALLAAQAAEAADRQGRFWPMHDLLFENQDALELDDILGYAAALGLDFQSLQEALGDRSVVDHIKGDFRGGVRSGVDGTPGFFVNGLKYDGPWIDRSLEEALSAMEPSHK